MGGLYFEELVPGRIIEHAVRRTVTEGDNTLFSCMTMNTQPLHLDHEHARASEWGQPLVNSLLTLSLLVGISVADTTHGTLVANLGMTDVRFPAPVFHGDTLRVTTEVASRRDSRSRHGAGLVEFHHRAFNQRDELVAECRRQVLMKKKAAGRVT